MVSRALTLAALSIFVNAARDRSVTNCYLWVKFAVFARINASFALVARLETALQRYQAENLWMPRTLPDVVFRAECAQSVELGRGSALQTQWCAWRHEIEEVDSLCQDAG